METDGEVIRRDEHEQEGRTRAAESNHRVDHHPRKVIPYKEHVAHQEKDLTANKLTLEDEENWDEEPPLPSWETTPRARPILSSQEDEWKLMVNQDPCSRSVAGDSEHGTMAMASEAKPVDSNEELIRAMGEINEDASTGINENVSAGYLSDVEWKEEDPLIKINDENVTISQMPAAVLTPIQALTENEMLSPLELPMGKKACFQELTATCLSKAASPLCLEPDYRDAELVGYTQPPLTNIIPWIKYKAQNMVEPTFTQELQCIREVDHFRYIIAMLVWFR